jgi:uncharacterized membrane protein
MKRSGSPARFLTPEEAVAVQRTVHEAESRTSAEIKVVLIRHCWGDIRSKAARHFRKLGLHKTELRNCVMIFLVLANREFLVYGDWGIHEKVGLNFWAEVRDVMQTHFRENRFAEGLCEGVRLVGERLAASYPRQAADRNEVSNEVVQEK